MVDFKAVQDKWQKKWEEQKVFEVNEDRSKKKFYCLEMYPYPSSVFLHMGHVRNYAIGDAIARFKRMNGYNVLYPMGYDSFGLPAENAAKKANIHPREYTEDAISKIIEYQKKLGLSYDWSRLIATHRPEYYKWNQFFFIKFFEKGLVYRKKAFVNYCPNCKTVLANEEVENGKCWRCHTEVIQKELDQWFFRTTAYADQLLEDLERLNWSEKIKTIQENWIGKSKGVMINFHLDNKDKSLFPIFTTRPDTIYGVTFMVIALNHPKLYEYIKGTPYELTINKYIEDSKKAELLEDKDFLEKSGVFTGLYAINPVNNERVPIYAGNFVVADYATGMIMAVPGHDERDYEFAKKYDINIKIVIQNNDHSLKLSDMTTSYIEDGILVHSESFNGLNNRVAIDKISDYLEKNGLGNKTVQYRLKDWLISRQRYWGTPIPMIFCDHCGIVPMSETDLPLLLPDDVDFTTLGNPLLTSKTFINTVCPKCNKPARRETDTMGGFMDSSWYFLRYCSPHTIDVPFDKDAVDYWMPVDQYVGGIEHAVGHLIYSRFFTKALRDMSMLDFDEPFNALFNQGIVYKDGHKMSKSYGNIVTQDDIANKYGIDTARLFMLFVAAPDKEMEWNDKGVEGAFKIIIKTYKLFDDYVNDRINCISGIKDNYLISKKNLFIKNITTSIDEFKLNTAVVQLMELVNYIYDVKMYVTNEVLASTLSDLSLLLNPFAPHLSEECWSMIGKASFASISSWPEYNDQDINLTLHFIEAMIENTKKDIYSVLELAKISKPSNINLIISEEWKYYLYEKVQEIAGISGKKDIAEISREILKTDLKIHGQEIMKMLKKLVEKQPEFILTQEQEYNAYKEASSMFEKEFSCVIKIVTAENSTEQKAKVANPGKPAIIVK